MRRGGEFSLLLTHALAREDREGPRRVKPERYRSGTSPRADQIAAWVQGRITTAVDRTTSLKDARLVQLEGTAFDQEVHTIAEVAAARTLVREVHALRELEARVNVEGGANAATLRAATAWVERGDERLAADAVVAVGEPHVLAVAIETHVRDYARTVVPFREEGIAEALRAAGEVELAAVVFADPTELEFTTGSAPLRLPIVGDSTTARLGFTARRPGAARVRVALYFRGQVLQSFALELACGEALPEGTGVSGIDWALTTDFAALDLLPAGGQTILVNDGPDGSHWFMARDREGGPLLRKYDDAQLGVWLKPLTTRLASALEQWNGEPFDPEKPRWDERADELVALARLGWSAYFKLFKDLVAEGTPDVGTDGRLTIARCEFSRYNPPWAALYRHKLDVTAGDIGLCPTFRARVEATEWSTEEIGEVELPAPAGGYHLPLLDEQACRAAAGCPLADPSRALRTVCPYGFLGMRGVLEQPLQDVPPGSKQHLDPGFTLPSVLASANPAVRIGYDRELMLSKDHAASIAKLFAPSREVTEQRDEVLRWIRHGGAQVLYVFCHAETLELSAEFGLRFGDDEFIVPSLVGFISKDPPFADDVPRPWPGGALVMLNGCDTVAPVTASLGDFVTLLRQLGAVGIVGTETPVETPIASEFGLRLLALLRGGEALGSAMLKLRRAFLWQMNPVGLTYTFYASASLHMHMSGRTCEICPEATS